MSYNPLVKVYYLKGAESEGPANRLVPAPKISIDPEMYYANDTIIGYTYNVSLNGYATSLDLTSPPSGTPGFGDVLESIQKVKNIFNGGIWQNNKNSRGCDVEPAIAYSGYVPLVK